MSSAGRCAAPCGPAKSAAPYSWPPRPPSTKSASSLSERGIPTLICRTVWNASGIVYGMRRFCVHTYREVTTYLGDELRIFDCDDFNSTLLAQSSAGRPPSTRVVAACEPVPSSLHAEDTAKSVKMSLVLAKNGRVLLEAIPIATAPAINLLATLLQFHNGSLCILLLSSHSLGRIPCMIVRTQDSARSPWP